MNLWPIQRNPPRHTRSCDNFASLQQKPFTKQVKAWWAKSRSEARQFYPGDWAHYWRSGDQKLEPSSWRGPGIVCAVQPTARWHHYGTSAHSFLDCPWISSGSLCTRTPSSRNTSWMSCQIATHSAYCMYCLSWDHIASSVASSPWSCQIFRSLWRPSFCWRNGWQEWSRWAKENRWRRSWSLAARRTQRWRWRGSSCSGYRTAAATWTTAAAHGDRTTSGSCRSDRTNEPQDEEMTEVKKRMHNDASQDEERPVKMEKPDMNLLMKGQNGQMVDSAVRWVGRWRSNRATWQGNLTDYLQSSKMITLSSVSWIWLSLWYKIKTSWLKPFRSRNSMQVKGKGRCFDGLDREFSPCSNHEWGQSWGDRARSILAKAEINSCWSQSECQGQ